MRIMGGKAAVAKYIIPVLRRYRKPGQLYVEPFLGAGSVFTHMEPPRIAYDKNPWLIVMWNALRDGWTPPKRLSEKRWKMLRDELPMDPVTAFAGFGCSWSGKWFSRYERTNYTIRPKKIYHYVTAEVCRRALLKKAARLLPSDRFTVADYCTLNLKNSFVYVDPPYIGRKTDLYGLGPFEEQSFWPMMRSWVKHNNRIIISSPQAPSDFICIAELRITISKGNTARMLRVAGKEPKRERLFTYAERIKR